MTSGRRFSLAFEHPKIDKSSKADSVDDWRLASKLDGLTTAFGPAWKKKGSGGEKGELLLGFFLSCERDVALTCCQRFGFGLNR